MTKPGVILSLFPATLPHIVRKRFASIPTAFRLTSAV